MLKNRKTSVFISPILIVAMFVSSYTRAEPSRDASSWLMQTNLSLMSWGLWRLNNLIRMRMESDSDEFITRNVHVEYSDENDRIVVVYSTILSTVLNVEHERLNKSDCHAAIEKGKSFIGFSDWAIDTANENVANKQMFPEYKKMLDSSYDILAAQFTGYGYHIKNQPDNVGEKIARMVVVKIEVKDFRYNYVLACQSPLLSHNIQYDYGPL